MNPTPIRFALTPFGLTNLALWLLTAASFVFLAQSRPRSVAGRWMLAHEACLALFLTALLLLNSTFLSAWYPVTHLGFVAGMACLLQFSFAFPHPMSDAGPAQRLHALSIFSLMIEVGLAISFWLAPQTGQAVLLRTVGLGLGLWQSLAALLVLAYRTVQLDRPVPDTDQPRRLQTVWRSLVWPRQPSARATRAMLLSMLAIAALAGSTLIYRLWLQPIVPETLFNIAWSIGLMLILAAFAMSYLVYTPEATSFRVKLSLGTLVAVLISVWFLSLVQPFQLQLAYDAARQAEVLAVQAEVSRADSFAANALPPLVTLLAACPVGPDGAASEPRALFVREAGVDLSGLCSTRFLIGSTYSQGSLDTLNVLYRFVQNGQTYLVGFDYAVYLQAVNPFTLPIALMMLGSTLIVMLFLPLTFYRNLLRPLDALLTGAQQVNQGRLDVVVPVQSNDEIGLLTRSFNAMAADLRTAVTNLEDQVTEHLRAAWAVHEQREQLRALTIRLAEMEEIERNKLGRELHDQVGQNLTALCLILKLVRTQLIGGAQDPALLNQLADHLDDAAELVRQTTQRIRSVMDDLQPPALDEFGLAAALRWLAARFTARTNIAVEVHSPEPAPRLPRQIEVALFRIAQEALTNVARHAQATRVDIQVRVDAAGTCLIIGDNGLGFDIRQTAPLDAGGRFSRGLRLMAERAAAVDGVCRVESVPGQGTQIIVEVQT